MENPTILVADGDPKNLQILRESLEASGFEVIIASDGLQAWQKISSDVPDLILSEVNLPKLDGFQLLEKLKADPVTSSIPLMFLTNRRELQDRVRSLRGGVKDYMIKPLHVKEVIARVRMILRRMERIREEEIDSNRKLAGRLEEYSVIDLIESFGMERKTGVLTLYNVNNKSGEVYFRDGAVVNATLGNLRAEKAVYQMLPWKHGHFTMTFKEINVPDEISVSNLGLLLQGFKRMEERERLFKMLPSPETTFVITEAFRNILQKREISTDVAKFIALIDGKRDILQIIDESTYDDIKTLERLAKLYQQGFIKPSKTQIAGEEEIEDMASTIAEPRILEQFTLGQTHEQRFGAHLMPEPEPPHIEARSEKIKPTLAPAFRPPAPIPPEPPEKHEEESIPTPESKARAASTIERLARLSARTAPPEEEAVHPEHLPIDLSALVKRPSESPPIEKSIEAPSPPPVETKAPATETPAEEAEVASPIIETSEPQPRIEPVAESRVETSPEAKAKIGGELEVIPPPPALKPELTAPAKELSEPATPAPQTTLITVTEAKPHPVDPIGSQLMQLLKNRTVQRPKLIIIGREGVQVSPMVRHLLGAESTLRRLESTTFQYLEIGERKLPDGRPFEIIGISMEQQFTRLLDAAGADLVGYIVLIEAHRKEGLEYLIYLLNTLKTVYRQPLGIAVIKSPEQKNMATETLQDLLNITPAELMQECTPTDKSSVLDFLNGFTAESHLQRWNPEAKANHG